MNRYTLGGSSSSSSSSSSTPFTLAHPSAYAALPQAAAIQQPFLPLHSKQSSPFTMRFLLLLFLASAVAALPIPSSIYALPVHSNSSQNSPAEAVALAASYYDAQTDVEPYLCDHYVGFWYGHDASGWPSAIDQWNGAAGQTHAIGNSNTRYKLFCRNARRQEVGRMDLWRAGVLRWRPVRTRRNLRGG
jgi:hypothetical protein